MKKLLLTLALLLVAAISFATSTVTDWSKYWTNRLTTVGVVAGVTKVNALYLVNFVGTPTNNELRIIVTCSDPTVVFTKYDNIAISAAIIKNLSAIKTYNGLTTIYIVTFPYTRAMFVKDLLAPPKKQNLMSITVLKDETQKKK
jgi:hypothetical protein